MSFHRPDEQLNKLAFTLGQGNPRIRENLTCAARYPEITADIELMMSIEAEERGYDPAKLPPFSQEVNPKPKKPVFIGRTVWDDILRDEVFLPVKAFNVSSGIFGTTNSGKSTLIMHLASQIIPYGIGFVFFDTQGEYRKLVKLVPREKVFVFNQHNFRCNIYEPPPNVPVDEWKPVVELWYRQQNLKEGSTNLMGETQDSAFLSATEAGREFPNIMDHLKCLQARQFKFGSRHFGYFESCEDRLKRMAQLPCFQCDKGFAINELADKVVVFEIGDLTDDKRIAFCTLVLLKLLSYFQKHPSSGGLRNVAVLDEAQVYVNEKISEKFDYGEGLLPQLARMSRKFGQVYWFSSQTLTGFTPSLLGVLDGVFCFRIPHAGSLQVLAKSRFLTPEQLEYLGTAPDRQLVLTAHEYPDPILVRVPEVQLPEVAEHEIQELMREKLALLPWVPDGSQGNGQVVSHEAKEPKKVWVKADEELKRFLVSIAKEPLLGTNERAKALGINAWQMQKRIKDSLQVGFIRPPVYLPMGKRSASKCILMLSESGARFIGADFDSIVLRGRGSDEHKLLQNILAAKLREKDKLNCFVEHSLSLSDGGSKSADLAVLGDDGGWRVVEIELDPACPHCAVNIERDLKVAREVTVVARNGRELRELQETIYKGIRSAEALSRVRFKTLKDILH